MKTHLKHYLLLGALLLGANVASVNAQLLPINCGAVSTNVGTKLKFVNGTNYSSDLGYVQLAVYGRYTNRFGTNLMYGTTNLLFGALSVKTNWDSSAAFGSYIACRVVSVSGPVGGVLSFWEQGAGWPTYQFPVNGLFATGKNQFLLSNIENGAGRPDGDPYGSIRGRKFTVNKAGEYLVTFKLYDIAKNHPTADASIHQPSDTLTIRFKTGVDMDITQFKLTNNVATVVFKQGLLTNMFVEASTDMSAWQTVAGPFVTAPTLTTNLFTNNPSAPAVFYRLRAAAP